MMLLLKYKLQSNSCNSNPLGVCEFVRIFGITGSLAISAKFRKQDTKGVNIQIVKNCKCLSVIQIYLTIYLHI